MKVHSTRRWNKTRIWHRRKLTTQRLLTSHSSTSRSRVAPPFGVTIPPSCKQYTGHSSTNMPLTRKKYRKMRIKFDDAMTKSNEYFNQERKAAETAKRLKQYNE